MNELTILSKPFYFVMLVIGNVAVYKDLNIEFVTKKRFCHENAV